MHGHGLRKIVVIRFTISPSLFVPPDSSNDASAFTYFLHAISTLELIRNAETCEVFVFADLMAHCNTSQQTE
jgi:F0F1-type ATP synthase beta subunit